MQNMFQKLAIAAVLSIGLSSSLMANDDLLAMATNGEVATTTEAIKLFDAQMSDVKGGATAKQVIYNNALNRSVVLNAMTPMQRVAALIRVK
jgi:hypothetical protein